MAEFKMLGRRHLGTINIPLDRNFALLNLKGTTTFCFAEADVGFFPQDGENIRYTSKRGVILTPDGVQVLPYFLDEDRWKLVMVEQFRIAIPGKTTECPGGQADHTDIQKCMVEELREETEIVIKSERIEIVFCEYMWPSMASAVAWGGIVEIKKTDLPKKIFCGEFVFGEYLAVAIHPLAEILKLRDWGEINLDLWTSRLLDEVAKKVGLLVRKY